MRVHEIAKKYKLDKDDLLRILRKAGFKVKSHMSGMTDEMVSVVKKHVKPAKAKTKVKAKAASKTVMKAKPKAKATVTTKSVVKKAKATVKAKAKTSPKVKPKAATVKKAASEAKAAPKPTKPSAKPPVRPIKPSAKVPVRPTPAKPKPLNIKESVQASAREAARQAKKPGAKPTVPATPVSQALTKGKQRPGLKRDAKTADAQQRAVRESVRRTLAKIEATRRTKRRKGKTRQDVATEARPVRVAEGATVRELAHAAKLEPEEILKRCLDLGLTTTANQSLEKDTIELISEDLGIDVKFESEALEELVRIEDRVEPERLTQRAPIVTVMGHVDHGKTSILDYIRKSKVAAGEAGGITQHIGAYEVDHVDGKITFVDTPGHQAFTKMRARGAHVTDIVVLVVAADDGVMPQTIEAINHAKAANVPIIVAVNKMDLPAANAAQVKQQLTEHEVVVEEFGGDVVSVEVSAKTGSGIDKLLEMVLLQAELMELKADHEAAAQAVSIEVKKEEGRGILCTVLVTQGTLKIGDVFVIGANYGKVRALLDHRSRAIKVAPPGMPVVVLGCNGLPEAGDKLIVVRSEREARDVSVELQQLQKDRERRTVKKLTLEELYSQIQQGELKELNLVIKGDTNGSVEALTECLTKLSIDEVGIKVIHAGVGVVGESDVLLAASSDALIVAFHVKVSTNAQEAAEREKVEIKNYDVIYECITEVDDAMKGLLEPEKVEKVLGRAEVRKVYKISRLGQIAGSFVLDGLISRNAMVRVLRDDETVFEGRIGSLKRFQDDVRDVQKDFECGIGVAGFNSLQEGDILEAFIIEEKARVFDPRPS